jgi:hypothetical protein
LQETILGNVKEEKATHLLMPCRAFDQNSSSMQIKAVEYIIAKLEQLLQLRKI